MQSSNAGIRLVTPLVVLLVTPLVMTCGDRRDVMELAVGVAPFGELRGTNIAQLRSGGVRAFRRAAAPAPFEGLREPIGDFDVVYGVAGYDGSDGSWPNEDALVLSIEATREWPTDSSASEAWRLAVRAFKENLALEPTCASITGPGFTLLVAEWDRGEGWSLSASFAERVHVEGDSTLSPRHSVAVRRQALTARYPESGQPNPDERPTWTGVPCESTARPVGDR